MSRSVSCVTVFCGSALGVRTEYEDAARALGRLLASQGIRLVYGGGDVGLMGVLADSALDAGGHVTGVIPRHLADKELTHPRVADMRIVGTMHERKQLMSDLADGFIALAGGPGTLEEISEQWTWSQLGYHAKPCVIINTAHLYDHFIDYVEHIVSEGFVRSEQAEILTFVDTPEQALAQIETYHAPAAKWA